MIVNSFKLFLVFVGFVLFTHSANANIETTTKDDVFEETESDDGEVDSLDQIVRSEKAKIHYDHIEQVLEREEFGKVEYEKAWRKIDTSDESNRDKLPEWLINFFEWLESIEPSEKFDDNSSSFFSIIEVVFWLLAIGLIVFIFVRYHKEIKSFATFLGGSKSKPTSLPATMFGLDIQKESLPEDIVGSARKHWSNGEVRSAVALLLRASLIRLLKDHECRFYDSDTEAECCLRIDRQVAKPLSEFMRRLVSIWQQVAYAHRSPDQVEFDSLCAQWQKVFS